MTVSRNVIVNAHRGIAFGNDNGASAALPDWNDYSPMVDNVCEWYDAVGDARCHEVIDCTATNNVIANVDAAGVWLAGTLNIIVAHNTLRYTAYDAEAAITLQALQHYITNANSPLVSNNNPVSSTTSLCSIR